MPQPVPVRGGVTGDVPGHRVSSVTGAVGELRRGRLIATGVDAGGDQPVDSPSASSLLAGTTGVVRQMNQFEDVMGD